MELFVALLLIATSNVAAQGDIPVILPTTALSSNLDVCPRDEDLEIVRDAVGRTVRTTLQEIPQDSLVNCGQHNYGLFEHCAGTSCEDILSQIQGLPTSGYYWITGSGGSATQEYCDFQSELCKLTNSTGLNELCPASSCTEVLASLPSGYYWITASDGSAVQTYCSRECGCGNGGGWTRALYFDMTDTSQTCPPGWMFHETPRRTCGRTELTQPVTESIIYDTFGTNYAQICGQIRGYQKGHVNGFRNDDIDDAYLDGVSVTYGNATREHIWSFAAARTDSESHDDHVCPCTKPNASNSAFVSDFVGTDFFCEAGTSLPCCEVHNTGMVFTDDPLWDGQGCPSTSTCCEFNSPPFFCKTLSQPTSEILEVRLMSNELPTNEDVLIELLEIFIQ